MKMRSLACVLMGGMAFGLGALAAACATSSATPDDAGGAGASSDAGAATNTGSTGTGVMFSFGTSTTGAASPATTSASATSAVSSGTTSTTTSVSSSSSPSSSGTSSSTHESSTHESSTHESSSHESGDAGCYSPPTKVYTETAAGVYCPFSRVDGGDNKTCTSAEHCCEPDEGTSTCEPTATACATSDIDWTCEGAPDCASMTGTVCCGTGTIKTQGAQPNCGDAGYPAFPYVSDFKGSSCKASCTTFQICSQTSECPHGMTCVPIEPHGNAIGYCKS